MNPCNVCFISISMQYLIVSAIARCIFHALLQPQTSNICAHVQCRCVYTCIFKYSSISACSMKVLSKELEETSVISVLILGASGVGKTEVKHLLLNKDPPTQDHPTGLAGKPDNDISFTLVRVNEQDQENPFLVVENDLTIIKEKEKYRSVKWIQFIECGGQLKYHDILPFLIPNPLVIIFVLNMSENLSHRGNDKQEQPFLSPEQIIQHCLGTICSQGAKPLIIFVGTHQDAKTYKLSNEQLNQLMCSFTGRVLYCDDIKKEMIFAVNCHTPERIDRDVAKKLTDAIVEEAPQHRLKWPITSLLRLEIKLLNECGGGFISLEDCQALATWLDKDVLIECLEHSNILVLCSNTVFCNPQVILTKVTELVQYCHQLRNTPEYSHAAVKESIIPFRDQGLLSKEQLRQFPKYYEDKNLFTEQDLVKLLVSRYAIAKINDDAYFMPALLDSIQVFPHPETSASLMIKFIDDYIPKALFCTLVSHMLSSANPTPWEVCMNNVIHKPLCLYRNYIKIRQKRDHTKIVTLIDRFPYIEVLVEKDSLEACKEIRDDVHSGIKKVCNVQFKDAFMCTGTRCTSKPHLAVVEWSKCKWICTMLDDQLGNLNSENHLRWYGSQESTGE